MKKLTTLALLLLLFNCVQETQPKVITLKVDMRGIENIDNVSVRGNTTPLSWEESIVLEDKNNDSIYETIIELKSASYNIQFKFVKNENEFELEGYNNRSIIFDYKPEKIVYLAKYNEPNPIEVIKK